LEGQGSSVIAAAVVVVVKDVTGPLKGTQLEQHLNLLQMKAQTTAALAVRKLVVVAAVFVEGAYHHVMFSWSSCATHKMAEDAYYQPSEL